MIQKHELRIGNVFIHPLKDKSVFIIRSGADIDEVYASQELKGYRISERILEKCAGIKVDDDTIWKIGELDFDLRNEGLALLDSAGRFYQVVHFWSIYTSCRTSTLRLQARS